MLGVLVAHDPLMALILAGIYLCNKAFAPGVKKRIL
jgi:hypothetical protein